MNLLQIGFAIAMTGCAVMFVSGVQRVIHDRKEKTLQAQTTDTDPGGVGSTVLMNHNLFVESVVQKGGRVIFTYLIGDQLKEKEPACSGRVSCCTGRMGIDSAASQ